MERFALFMTGLVWRLLVLLCAFLLAVMLTRVTFKFAAPAHLEIKPPQEFSRPAGPAVRQR